MTEAPFHRRLFIFDLDGVLVDSKDTHFEALNFALSQVDKKYIITREEQATVFEGLPTKEKLKILTETRGLPVELHESISKTKQEQSSIYFKNLEKDLELRELFKIIKNYHVDIAVASNCIRETVESCLTSLGVIDLVNLYLSNEDVSEPKPSPEIYEKCIKHFGNHPNYTTIFEDSLVGKTAAFASGATLVSVQNRKSLNKELILNALYVNRKKINVLIPMAGEGSRFTKAGYTMPKPMIDVEGKSMINLVHDNIDLNAHYIFIAKSEHISKYNLEEHIGKFCKDYTIIAQDGRLEGAAKTALLAKDIINNDEHLLIANSDQYVDWNSNEAIDTFIKSGVDGGILTFKATEEKWSYAKIGTSGNVEKVFEKIVVGDNATCGIYYWKSGSDFVKYAEDMIEKEIRTNNEFYICPVYNQAIEDDKIISYYQIKEMHGLGTPEDLEKYLKHLDSLIDIDKRDYVDSVFEISSDEICVKYKNPAYEIYDRQITKADVYHKWDYENDLVKLPESYHVYTDRVYRWMLNPIITSIHTLDNPSYPDRSVYLTAYTTRFFHIYLEILPKLFLLKEIDPDFKLIILGDEKINDNGDFVGLVGEHDPRNGREGDSRSLKFWLDALKIDYDCINIENLDTLNLNFKSSYCFYERVWEPFSLKAKKQYEKLFFNGPTITRNLNEYHPFSMLNRGDAVLDFKTNTYLKKQVNKFIESNYPKITKQDKKVYISRKNYLRVHKNELEIEKYFIDLGYTSVCMEDLNPIEQIQILRESSDVVCYLGSSLINMYFANKKTNLIILSLDSDSDKDFNTNMNIYYRGNMEDQDVDIKFIELPEEDLNVNMFLNEKLGE